MLECHSASARVPVYQSAGVPVPSNRGGKQISLCLRIVIRTFRELCGLYGELCDSVYTESPLYRLHGGELFVSFMWRDIFPVLIVLIYTIFRLTEKLDNSVLLQVDILKAFLWLRVYTGKLYIVVRPVKFAQCHFTSDIVR